MQLAVGASVPFDAVFVALSEEGSASLMDESAAVAWVHDSFAHCKVIGATIEARTLLDKAGVQPDEGVLVGGKAKPFVDRASDGRIWPREPKVRTIY